MPAKHSLKEKLAMKTNRIVLLTLITGLFISSCDWHGSRTVNGTGDVESMEGVDWRNDAVSQILQCTDAMADDYWLVSGSGGQEAAKASHALATMLAPLYGPYCMCRVKMSCMEEHFMARECAELDEIREEISVI